MAGTSTNGIEPVRRLKVSDSVAAQLEQLILRGDFKPGEKLPPERVLSEQFGVGRSSMREALRMVEASGLVRTTHGVGVFVTDSKAKPGTDLRRLIADASDPELSDEGFVKLDAELHRAIAKITQNGLLLRIMDSIQPLFLTYSYRVIELPGRRAVAHAGHAKIVEAIAAHHIRDARNAAVKHIREVEQDIVRHLQRPETER
jgi:GntR family transcriptional repressor for pyruvate dehydrogenase complex